MGILIRGVCGRAEFRGKPETKIDRLLKIDDIPRAAGIIAIVIFIVPEIDPSAEIIKKPSFLFEDGRFPLGIE